MEVRPKDLARHPKAHQTAIHITRSDKESISARAVTKNVETGIRLASGDPTTSQAGVALKP